MAVQAMHGTFANWVRNMDNLRYAGRKSWPQLGETSQEKCEYMMLFMQSRRQTSGLKLTLKDNELRRPQTLPTASHHSVGEGLVAYGWSVLILG